VTAVDPWTGPHALETFLLARERFGNKAADHRLDVHDLSAEAVGGTFDIVFCAGVRYPGGSLRGHGYRPPLTAAGFARHEIVYTPSWWYLKKLAAPRTGLGTAG
jgi:hypothetical protein